MSNAVYGGFWRRLLAYVIDQIILYFISVFLFLIGAIALAMGGTPFADLLTTDDLPREMGLFGSVYGAAAFLTGMAYFTWFHGAVGQTPGKMLFRLRVVQITGERMTFGIAFLRWVGSLVSGLVLGLGFLWVAFDPRRQGWHDKIAATLVVRVGAESRIASPSPAPLMEGEPIDYTLTEDAPFPVDAAHRPEDEDGCIRTDLPARLPCPQEPCPANGDGAPTSPPPRDAAMSANERTGASPTACEGETAPEKCLDK